MSLKRVDITGISKPYPAPLFNLFPFTLQVSFEFGSFKNLYTNLNMLRGICLVHTSGISNDDQNALFGIKENLERIVITQKMQKDIRDYF